MALFLPDVNVLLHALRKDSEHHDSCRRWLTEATRAGHEIGLTDLVEVALLRIPTLPRLNLVPMETVAAFWQEDLWTYAGTRRLAPPSGHVDRLAQLIERLALRGNDINDAWLAAMAIGHGATLVSIDGGFGRFPGLAWVNPEKPL